jgi:hypothetical protein
LYTLVCCLGYVIEPTVIVQCCQHLGMFSDLICYK